MGVLISSSKVLKLAGQILLMYDIYIYIYIYVCMYVCQQPTSSSSLMYYYSCNTSMEFDCPSERSPY